MFAAPGSCLRLPAFCGTPLPWHPPRSLRWGWRHQSVQGPLCNVVEFDERPRPLWYRGGRGRVGVASRLMCGRGVADAKWRGFVSEASRRACGG